jgi:hypothetical protein
MVIDRTRSSVIARLCIDATLFRSDPATRESLAIEWWLPSESHEKFR